MAVDWAAWDEKLDQIPGTVSVWYAPVGASVPRYARHQDATHYAASTMKVSVLAALIRAAEAGRLDLDRPVPVVNDFASALPGAPRFSCDTDYDNDPQVWQRLGGTASLRWLAERMIVRSSNFATNLVLAHVGGPAVTEAWRLAGARHSKVCRGIEDAAAREAGLENLVTAADLAGLLSAIAIGAGAAARPERPVAGRGPMASRDGCRAMLDILLAQEHREDLAAGLPPGTRIAHKNGWIPGIRHGAGIVFPDGAPPYAVVVCTTTSLAAADGDDDPACRLLAEVAAATWADNAGRHAQAG